MKKTLLGHLCPFSRQFSRILPSRIMLMFLVISLHAFQLQAADTVGKISLHANGKPLKEVLHDIEAQTDYRFFYSNKLVDENQKVSVDVNNVSIGAVVTELLKADPSVTFKIKGDQVMIKRQRKAAAAGNDLGDAVTVEGKSASEAKTEETDVLNAEFEADVDPITVTGTVLDETNTPLPGVSVLVKGTTIGTATDSDGKYTLSIPDGTNVTLVYSFIGYMPEEVPLNNRTAIDVNLVPDISTLSEVVVVGFGTVKKRDNTGSIASVKTSELVLTPTHNAVESMQGRVAGVDIQRTSGAPGSGSAITIRGNRTITGANTSPLYVVDGVQLPLNSDPNAVSPITNINPNDIESIEVLKDASATAIYGAMGANGVILVTTKKGSEGKTKVSYNGYYGINKYSYPEARVGEDWMNLRRDAYRLNGQWSGPADDAAIFNNPGEWDAIQAGQWVNWVDKVKHDGRQQSHSISVSTGTQKTKVFASGSYFREDGMLRNQDYSRYNMRFNIDHTINDWVKIGLLSQLSYTVQNARQDPMSQALSISPLGLPYDANGQVNVFPIALDPSKVSPLADERTNSIARDNTIGSNVLANGYLELNPVKGLTFRSNFGTNLSNSRRGFFNDKTSLASKVSTATNTTIFIRSYNWDNILTYNKDINDHNITVTGITSYIQSDEDRTNITGTNQIVSSQLYYGLDGTTISAASDPYKGWKNMAYAGRIVYNYKSKYLLTVSGRYDGASRLSPGNKWAFFPSVAAAWNIADENFMSSINQTLSALKLRASYGKSGNYSIAEYGTQNGLVAGRNMSFGEVPAPMYQFKTTIGNPNLGWETTATTDLGLDIEILNGVITSTIDVYKSTTSDILLQRNLPISTGVGSVFQNIGETQNKGIEVAVTSRNINRNDFKWSSTLTVTSNKEQITKLIDGRDIIQSERDSYMIGRPIKSFYTFVKQGIWQTSEADVAQTYHQQSATGAVFKPGDIKLQDRNNDNIIDATNDRAFVGSTVPKIVIGLQNNFTYKQFDLGVFLFARYGQTIDAQFLGRYNPSGVGNAPAFINYWTPEHPTNDFPMPKPGASLSNYLGYQSLNFIDGSYFKVKNVTFGYTLPSSIASKLSISRVRFYVTGSNLVVKAKSHLIKDYDPERNGNETSPLSKTYVFGVNVDF